MKKNTSFLLTALLLSIASMAQEHQGPPPLEGRWDIHVDWNGKPQPAWLEVRHSGINKLVGRIMIVSGSARPISKINYKDGAFNFTIPPQWDNSEVDIKIEGTLVADKLKGTIQNFDGKVYAWEGVRAPSLRRAKPTEWAAPVSLFNGKDLTGWHTNGPQPMGGGGGRFKKPEVRIEPFSDQSFNDFKLHIEFRYPKGSNSGVYLRGRYEVQVADSKGLEPWDDQLGGVYGLLPNEMVAKEAGEWQTYDITLVGRTVTIVANGVAIISNQVIPGVTGGAIDSKEGEPGPFMIQGDHGPVEYRNIVVTPAK